MFYTDKENYDMKRHFPTKRNKCIFGEVHTPFQFIQIMLDMFPKWVFTDSSYTWLDPCCGRGYFMMMICNALQHGLKETIYNEKNRKTHILKNMIHMCEIQESYKSVLLEIFGELAEPHIYMKNFLEMNTHLDTTSTTPQPSTQKRFDVIIGNPPFNINGRKPNPSNYLYTGDETIQEHSNKNENILNEKTITIWPDFIRKSYDMLKDGGFLCMVVPSIWLKPDKAGIHSFIFSRKHTIYGIRSFSCSEIIRMFDKQVQTPMTIVLLRKMPTPFTKPNHYYLEVPIYDHFTRKMEYIQYNENDPLPMHTPSIVNKLLIHSRRLGTLCIIKTNLPKKHVTNAIVVNSNSNHTKDSESSSSGSLSSVFVGVKSCCFQKSYSIFKIPILTTERSTFPYPYTNQPKLILAHKMYGIPYYDSNGTFGISNRDNYILLQNSPERTYTNDEMKWLEWYLGSPLVLFLFDTTRYRMRYLEKYAFQYVPDLIRKTLNGYEIEPTYMYDDRVLCYALGLTESETKFIMSNYSRYKTPIVDITK